MGALGRGLSVEDALAESVATAGRSILVAGLTVIVSLMGLFLMGLGYLQGVALSTVVAVVVSMAASVTLLPAALGLVGRRVVSLSLPGRRKASAAERAPEHTTAGRWASGVQRRPLVALAAGVALIGVLSVPALDMRLGFPDAGNAAPGTMSRTAYDMVAEGFGPGSNGPLYLVAQGSPESVRDDVPRLIAALRDDRDVAGVAEPALTKRGDVASLIVTPATGPQSEATKALTERVRSVIIPASRGSLDVKVGGATAANIDQSQVTGDRLPLFVGSVVLLSMLLLLAAFRSIAVPLKAAVLTLLSIGAAYGVVTVLAQGGWVGGLIGIDEAVPVPPFIPIMLFAILFGLSMDYEVFLVSRIREAKLAGRSAAEAVSEGLGATAGVITAAALIMMVVFAGFGFGDDVGLKLIGVGLASAVFIDATVVRLLLVPAILSLLGESAWWLPRSLDRVLPHFELEAAAPPAASMVAVGSPGVGADDGAVVAAAASAEVGA